MIPWVRVPITDSASSDLVREGADVPARVRACEVLRRGEAPLGFEVGAAREAIDWAGLDEAIEQLDARQRRLRALAELPIDPVLAEIARPFEGVERVRSAPLPPPQKK